jgi:hypothetical protein
MVRRAALTQRARAIGRLHDSGQSLVESCFIIILICLIFFGFLQAALLYNRERVLQFASFAAARSATVGFNEDVFTRAYRAGAIPSSGPMSNPAQNLSQVDQLAVEQIDIPVYLNPENSPAILNYDYWDRYNMRPTIVQLGDSPAMLQEFHDQEHPLTILQDSGFLGAIRGTGKSTVMIRNEATMAMHYWHYLE